ncbi:MAG: class I SAM-dependent methyltransferase [Actinomycetota bacterium]
MSDPRSDAIAAFYDRHPYPPPVDDLAGHVALAAEHVDRFAHHRIWPSRRPESVRSVLVAGCGTSQAARIALREPGREVVGIDVSATSIEHTRRLVERHAISNLTVEQRPIEEAGALGRTFDHVVCTGVLHHLADPDAGLAALASVLAPGGALSLMVYAPHGRLGVDLIQEYCRILGVTTEPDDIADLVAALRELLPGHPLSRLLRETRDFHDDDALADALLNPRDRSYSVGELFDLLDGAGLRFGRWLRQAPYLADCGSISETPHRDRVLALPLQRQFAAMEAYRGTIDRHSVIARRAVDSSDTGDLDGDDLLAADLATAVPIVAPSAVTVTDDERLPVGTAAALLDRGQSSRDLVMCVDRDQLAEFRAIDGERTVTDLGIDPDLIRRLVRHDLVVLDTSGAPGSDSAVA